jgi:hypothetical protein
MLSYVNYIQTLQKLQIVIIKNNLFMKYLSVQWQTIIRKRQ